MRYARCPACGINRVVIRKGPANNRGYAFRRHKSVYPPQDHFAKRVALNDVCRCSGMLLEPEAVSTTD